MIARADFNRLLEQDGGRKVSLNMLRHIAGRDTRQDPARLRALLNCAESKLTGVWVIDEIAEAGRDGRVDTPILSDACEAQIEDALLDAALSLSLRNGGGARLLPQGMMPAQAPAAAIFRY